MKRDYRSLKRKKETFVRNPFDMNSAKVYLIIMMVLFHIVPLIFKAFGDVGEQMYVGMFAVMINPMAIFAIMLFYGIRVGLNFKMPAICAGLELLSLFMYCSNVSGVIKFMTSIQSIIVLGITYSLFTFLAIFAGSFVKRYMA